MRILAIADEESAYLWDFFEKSKLEGIDLIISCGDLDPNAVRLYLHRRQHLCIQRDPDPGTGRIHAL